MSQESFISYRKKDTGGYAGRLKILKDLVAKNRKKYYVYSPTFSYNP